MGTIFVNDKKGPPFLLQVLYFIFIGWWLGEIWIVIAWLFMVTIVGIPIGVAMFNKVPQVIALRQPRTGVTVSQRGNTTVVTTGVGLPQHNILVRAVYFLLIGIWLSALWVELAYAISLTIIGLPLGFWMFDRVPGVTSLRRA